MDWKLLMSTFVVVFLAELGDKTQLAVLFGSSSTGKFWEVFIGASLALVLSTLIAALLGEQLATHLPERVVRLLSGIAFVGIGVFMIVRG
ncbi:conserved hypothetical protein [Thermosulfidibacter takaii ABI70S6]|uniref:GDT1 family protein n=1 Tax=Thermosulfidibacter takaii (strain DSM 17441 / JCM 13301 / NBRC 103674 / ABI70S6) TaxID=1298851 RepID=A0A0S3QVL8_THET7|nr:TMEM165/GDT1 family protein [Thermosulfidibacter takaii]BAT72378.1 conserved hypothetical protein [Thermosulfidibacter takaii ABI70S6]